MHYQVTKKVVTDLKLFAPTGDFGRWIHRIEFELNEAATLRTPVNKRQNKSWGEPPVGTLKASTHCEWSRRGLRTFVGALYNDAHYASWVHEGTSTIFSKSARTPTGQFAPLTEGGMVLPANFGIPALVRQRVRGQRANPFLKRGYNDVAAHHPALKRFSL